MINGNESISPVRKIKTYEISVPDVYATIRWRRASIHFNFSNLPNAGLNNQYERGWFMYKFVTQPIFSYP